MLAETVVDDAPIVVWPKVTVVGWAVTTAVAADTAGDEGPPLLLAVTPARNVAPTSVPVTA